MDMRIDPISVDKLKNYDWYYSVDHNDWYYYKDRKSTNINDHNLDNTLDPNIKKILKMLLGLDFVTLPSCEGHNRDKKFIDGAWNNLQSDAKKISSVGLWLYNCENNDRVFLYDPNWKIPFSYKEFEKICSGEKEVVGYVGFKCEDKDLFNSIRKHLSSHSNIRVSYKDGAIEIYNTAKDSEIRNNNWKTIKKVLEKVLR